MQSMLPFGYKRKKSAGGLDIELPNLMKLSRGVAFYAWHSSLVCWQKLVLHPCRALSHSRVSWGNVLSSPETQRRDVDLRPVRSFPAIDELRIGVLEPIDGPNGDKLGAPDVNVELLFGRFGPEYQSSFLNHLLRPRLDLGTSISTSGDTSEFYVGLTWDVFFTKSLFLEGSAGGALHSDDDHAFGCSANFRESGSVGVMLSERWDMLFTVDHMSNANLCGENRGLTDVGIRLGRKW